MPTTLEYVPRAQFKQTSVEVAPDTEDQVPSMQPIHTALDVAVKIEDHAPARQLTQELAPVMDEKDP